MAIRTLYVAQRPVVVRVRRADDLIHRSADSTEKRRRWLITAIVRGEPCVGVYAGGRLRDHLTTFLQQATADV
jgi:hypothetical protein